GNVLRIAELRRGNFFAAKIGWLLDGRICPYYQGCAGIGRARNDTDLLPVRFEIRVERRTRTDVGGIERSGEDRLHRRRSRIISEPLDLDIGSQSLLKPAFALARKRVRDHPLCVRDVREMSETNHRFFFCSDGLHEKRKGPDYRHQYFCLHSLFSIGEVKSAASSSPPPRKYELALIRSN